MVSLLRSLSAPFFSLILMMLGSGLFNTFTSIRLEMAGCSTKMIGLVTSALYVGILIGSLWIGRWVGKTGHIRAFILLAGASSLLTLLQALWIDPLYWMAIRFFAGICMAGIFIVIESWLLLQSPPQMRGQILSLYLAVFYGALSLGQLLINAAPLDTIYPFCITAGAFAASLLPYCWQSNEGPKQEEGKKLKLTELFKISPLGFLGGVISGMLLAAVYGLVPVYAAQMGMKVAQIGTLMAIIIFGGLSFQWPMGFWADQGNRQNVLNTSSFMASLCAIAITAIPEGFSLTFLISAWFFGGFSFTIYPLSMAFSCEKITQDQIVAATGGFVLAYGLGAIAGPLLAPIAMSFFGISGLFYFLSAITLILGISGLKRNGIKK
jgi:MFS family permease